MNARSSMPRPKSDNDTALHLLLPGDWLEEAQKLAAALSRPGVPLTRADAIRLCIRRGLDELMSETTKKRR